jgi:hypothetical protein
MVALLKMAHDTLGKCNNRLFKSFSQQFGSRNLIRLHFSTDASSKVVRNLNGFAGERRSLHVLEFGGWFRRKEREVSS